MSDKKKNTSKILTSPKDILGFVDNGMSVMVGGFLGVGSPHALLEVLAESELQNLTLISSDTCYPNQGNGLLIASKKIKKLYASHIGTNTETGAQFNEGTLEVEFVPQGTLVERIRAAGAGLGGVLTPTGVGTLIAEHKQTVEVDSVTYLVEKPLRAQIALLKAYRADSDGNLVYRKSMRNFNPIMATAADVVIAEVDEIVDSFDPNFIHTPGILVDYIVPYKRGL